MTEKILMILLPSSIQNYEVIPRNKLRFSKIVFFSILFKFLQFQGLKNNFWRNDTNFIFERVDSNKPRCILYSFSQETSELRLISSESTSSSGIFGVFYKFVYYKLQPRNFNQTDYIKGRTRKLELSLCSGPNTSQGLLIS